MKDKSYIPDHFISAENARTYMRNGRYVEAWDSWLDAASCVYGPIKRTYMQLARDCEKMILADNVIYVSFSTGTGSAII